MWATSRLVTSRCLFNRANNLVLRQSRATFIKGYYPEPITQQTLHDFLADIDYFERPAEFIDIGLKLEPRKPENDAADKQARVEDRDAKGSDCGNLVNDVDQLLSAMGKEIDPPPLNVDDAILTQSQLKNLAIHHGIYRDLFQRYQPRRDLIKFLPEQAKRLSKLVPHYWITDQPFARVDRHLKRTEPLKYFEPVVRISARFVRDSSSDKSKDANTVYQGNVIPASEALIKPSITLDGRFLRDTKESNSKFIDDSSFPNWVPGQVTSVNFDKIPVFHTLVMLNLDSIQPDSANLHWMLTNISQSSENTKLVSEEVCEYLPVHGIRGFGHSRFVFLLLRHESRINVPRIVDFSAQSRRFDTNEFIGKFSSANMTPVGVSWFQTAWDHSSNQVFHDYLKMRAPVYEIVQEKLAKREFFDKAYPGKIPFNLFMDHAADKKKLNERVLLERLKSVNPYDYSDQYEPPKVPPSVFENGKDPSWMYGVTFKKNNKLGYWRGLRPASATIPFNNNADLDEPIKPLYSTKKSLPGQPNPYQGNVRKKLLKDLPYSKPANEHTNVFVVEKHEVFLDKVKEMMKEMKKEVKA